MQVSQANSFAADRLLSLRRGSASPGTVDASPMSPEQQGGRQARNDRGRRETSPSAPPTVLRFEPVGGYAAATTRAFSSSLVALDLSALPADAPPMPSAVPPSPAGPAAPEPSLHDLIVRALSDP